jgi:hypothetical protein
MPLRPFDRVPLLILAGVAVLFGLALTHSPGTSDVQIWLNWLNNSIERGAIRGFAANHADYPPLASTLLYAANRALQPFGVDPFLSLKYSLLFFLLVTAGVFLTWTRSLQATLILYFALLHNSVALGYLDIYFAPTLVLALWALKQERWVWFSLLFALTCLIKWQPAIVAPFLVLYALGIRSPREWRDARWRSLITRVILPGAALAALIVAIFDVQPFWQALHASFTQKFLSGDALNLNWISTHFLHVRHPSRYGSLENGLATFVVTSDPDLTRVPRLLFAATYLMSLIVFFLQPKTFTNLLLFSLLGFLCYFTFNVSVHENHLFAAVILAAVLYWQAREWRTVSLIVMVISDVNLFEFYGADGILRFPRLFAGIDMALPLAAANVTFWAYFAARLIIPAIAVPREAPSSEPGTSRTARD